LVVGNLTLEDGTDMLFLTVGNKPQILPRNFVE